MSVLKYLRRKSPEIEILDGLNKHLNLCVKAADLLSEATNYKIKGDQAKAHTIYKEVTQTEEEADYQRREIIDNLAKGVLPPISKEDMMNLVGLLDTVVDWTNTSSQFLDMIDFSDIPEMMIALFSEQIKLGHQCVHALKDTIQTLYDDYTTAQDKCNLVEIIEHEMDNIYLQIHQEIYRGHLSVNQALILKELADSLEMMGDSCEDTSDLVRVVAVSAFH